MFLLQLYKQISGILLNDGHAIVFNGSIQWNTLEQKQNPIRNAEKLDQNEQQQQHNGSFNTAAAASLHRKSPDILVSTTNLTDGRLLIDQAEDSPTRLRPKRQSGILIDATFASANGSSSETNVDQVDSAASSLSQQLETLSGSVDMSIGQADKLAFVSTESSDRAQPEVDDESMALNALGSTAEAQNQAERPSVTFSGANLAYDYKFEAFYLRFGSQNSQAGSEHRVNSHAYAGELQLISYNSHLYKSFNEALNKPNGVMAIAILIDIATGLNDSTIMPTNSASMSTQESNVAQTPEKQSQRTETSTSQVVMPNAHLEQLLMQMDKLKHRTSMVPIDALNVSALLTDCDQFVAYEGSLTTPGCYESVHWLVLNRPLYISQRSVSLPPILFSSNVSYILGFYHQVGESRHR